MQRSIGFLRCQVKLCKEWGGKKSTGAGSSHHRKASPCHFHSECLLYMFAFLRECSSWCHKSRKLQHQLSKKCNYARKKGFSFCDVRLQCHKNKSLQIAMPQTGTETKFAWPFGARKIEREANIFTGMRWKKTNWPSAIKPHTKDIRAQYCIGLRGPSNEKIRSYNGS